MIQHSSWGKKPKTRRGRETREKLLQAAEIEFGERGYSDASISGITRRAGVAMGTFYVYFDSKEEVFRGLVAYMGELTRHWIAARVAESPNRLAAERQGFEAFFDFVRSHRNLYKIVSEAQFVAEEAFQRYYSIFADAYKQHLQDAVANDEIRDGDCEVWGWALIGMTVFLGMRYAAWNDERPSSDIAAAAADLISLGMAKQPRSAD